MTEAVLSPSGRACMNCNQKLKLCFVYRFLFDKQSSGYKYYEKRLAELSTPSQPSKFLASVPMPTPPPPVPMPQLPIASSQKAQAAARLAAENIASKLTASRSVLSGGSWIPCLPVGISCSCIPLQYIPGHTGSEISLF